MKEPKLRFPEFIGNWKQYKISEIGNIITGSTPKTSISENYGGDFLFVSPADIQGNRYIDKTITTLTKKGFDQGRKIREKASLFVSIGSTIGKVAQTHQELTTNQQINAVEPYNNFDDDFIFTSLENVAANIKAIASNQAVPIVNKTTFGNVEIRVPSEFVEQQKIGSLFTELDTLIQSAEKELEGYRELKQGMLQKMFPKKGEKVPEIRFPEFTGDWEQRKLEDVANRFDNLRVPVASSLRIKGTTPYYGANGIQDYVDGFTHEGEYVLVAEDGANDLINYPVNYVNGRIWVNNHAHVLQGKNNVANNRYLSYAISRINMQSVLVGGGRAKLNAEVMMNLDLFLPNIAEQKKIGEYFSSLDNLIALQQKEIDGYKELKKGLLQQMFC